MACRDAYEIETINSNEPDKSIQAEENGFRQTDRLLFGVDSDVPSNDILQNNLTEFEWVTRNKLYPNFWGRKITGESGLTKDEITFLHSKGCKIAAVYNTSEAKETEEQGQIGAKKAALVALELGIPKNHAIFLDLEQDIAVTRDYLKGYAQTLLSEGYTPGFKANTDASFGFDLAYSRGMQTDRETFSQCLIWAEAPSLEEYEHITTTHLIHPDNWTPYAPSGTTRGDIAIWKYGKNCHPIYDDAGKETVFHLNLVKNEQIIMNKMF